MSSENSKPWLPQTAAPEIIFYNASVVNVEAGEIIPNAVVHINNGRIIDVSSGDLAKPPTGPNAVDLKGQYICPGLIDCHVHLTATPGSPSLKDMFAASPNSIAHRTAFVAREMLLRGSTSGVWRRQLLNDVYGLP
jgi:imidazolonepropionase-like amidohydrolase